MAAALHDHGEFDSERLQGIARGFRRKSRRCSTGSSAEFVEWTDTPGWSGSAFTRLVVELADLPGHPARAIARRAKTVTELWLADLLSRQKVSTPRQRAKEIMVLMEGAMVLMLMHGDRSYGHVASRAAKQLLQGDGRDARSRPAPRRRVRR